MRALLLRWRFGNFVFFHAEIDNKAIGQFLIGFDMRIEFWRCAALNIFHCRGVERLPKRWIGLNALLHHVGERHLLQYSHHSFQA